MTNLLLLEKKLDRIERKLSILITEKKAETWVKVSVVQDLTGLDKVGLAKARENGLLQMKKLNGSILYKLESIHPILLKKQTA